MFLTDCLLVLVAVSRLKAIDVLPSGDGASFHPSAEESAAIALADLLLILESQTPESWMTKYFQYDVELAKLDEVDYPNDSECEFATLGAQARLVKLHDDTNQKEQANDQWQELKTELQRLNATGQFAGAQYITDESPES